MRADSVLDIDSDTRDEEKSEMKKSTLAKIIFRKLNGNLVFNYSTEKKTKQNNCTGPVLFRFTQGL